MTLNGWLGVKHQVSILSFDVLIIWLMSSPVCFCYYQFSLDNFRDVFLLCNVWRWFLYFMLCKLRMYRIIMLKLPQLVVFYAFRLHAVSFVRCTPTYLLDRFFWSFCRCIKCRFFVPCVRMGVYTVIGTVSLKTLCSWFPPPPPPLSPRHEEGRQQEVCGWVDVGGFFCHPLLSPSIKHTDK